jgi:hypothetical protein
VGRTLGLRIRDRGNRPCTVVLLRGANDLDIPGNLEGHTHHLGISRERVRRLYQDLQRAAPADCCEETSGANQYLRLGRIVDPPARIHAADRVIAILDEFVEDCRGSEKSGNRPSP